MKKPDRPALGWAMYDWANSAFATTVMAGFFPVFFKEFWAKGLNVADSTFWLGTANSVAAMLVVVLAPLIGLWCERLGMKKRLLTLLMLLGVVTTGSLFLVQMGHWPLALLLYIGGVLGFSGGNVAYDSMLPALARGGRFEWLSSLGYSLGYLGGGLLFAVNVWMVQQPAFFGLADAGAAVRWSFLLVAIWWALFSLPVLLWVPDDCEVPVRHQGGVSVWQELATTWRELRSLPIAFTFLIAYWLYIDGVDTIIRMAVDYGLSLGFAAGQLLTALLITQIVGFPAALVFGALGQRIGAKRGILIAIMVYILVVFWAWRMQDEFDFYGLAIAIGLVQGGIQALSRALFARLIPERHAGRYFGLFNMMGKFAAVLGPFLMGVVTLLSNNPRTGILSVLVLFGLALILLARVDVARGQAQAAAR